MATLKLLRSNSWSFSSAQQSTLLCIPYPLRFRNRCSECVPLLACLEWLWNLSSSYLQDRELATWTSNGIPSALHTTLQFFHKPLSRLSHHGQSTSHLMWFFQHMQAILSESVYTWSQEQDLSSKKLWCIHWCYLLLLFDYPIVIVDPHYLY